MWTDSHCHLQTEYTHADSSDGDHRAEGPSAADLVSAACQAGVERMVCVGTSAGSSRAAVEIALADKRVWATVGLHPHEASTGAGQVASLLDELSPPERARVVAVGECGLDYHYDHSPRPVQREAFAAQIDLAHHHGLALVVHTREAWDDTLAILSEAGVPERTVLHCFTGGPDEARRCLEMGAWISFSGIVTFKGAVEVAEAARICPMERMLVETDAPFLAPVPHRGKTNQPAYVPLVGARIAELRGVPVGVVEEQTSANAAAVFGL